MFGAGFSVLSAFPFVLLLDTGVAVVIWLAIVLGFVVGNGVMVATQLAFFSELLGTDVSYNEVSLGYQVSAVFAGGLAPFIATAWLAWAASYWPVALYIQSVSLVSFVSVYLA